MTSLFLFLYLLALGLWLGSLAYYLLLASPWGRQLLDPALLERLLEPALGLQQLIGAACGGVAVLCNLVLWATTAYTAADTLGGLVLLLLMLALVGYIRLMLLPNIRQALDAHKRTGDSLYTDRAVALGRVIAVLQYTVLILGLLTLWMGSVGLLR